MKKHQHEQYEYARKRIQQKKRLFFHFVLLLLGSFFLFISNKFFGINIDLDWHIWGITVWVFVFILHFIKVYITDRFMNKDWEREQIDRLIKLQQKKINQLETKINEESSI
ncbi:MAG: hypothetical protein RL619_275 [Bacteroidota bacterium]|jgi:hypothetical protein